jgi:CDP-diacylglycerol--glycerol-3-phosphate 3-phosphatidyltransferase
MAFFLIDNVYLGYVATLVFCLAALTDLYDGYLAKKTGVVTGFGKFMDPLADKILTSIALISFVALDYVEAWIVLVIIVREFLVTGLRSLAAYKGLVIMPSILAQWKTALQMIAIIIILLFINLKATLVPLGYHCKVFDQAPSTGIFNIIIFILMLLSVGTGIDYLVKNAPLLKGVLK